MYIYIYIYIHSYPSPFPPLEQSLAPRPSPDTRKQKAGTPGFPSGIIR